MAEEKEMLEIVTPMVKHVAIEWAKHENMLADWKFHLAERFSREN